MSKKLKKPSVREDAEIDRGIELDSDTRVLSDSEWARAKRLSKIDPALAESNQSLQGATIKQYHVVPRGEGWTVKRIGARTAEIFSSKSDAIARARKLAAKSSIEWVEYRRDGTVRDIHRPPERAPRARLAQT